MKKLRYFLLLLVSVLLTAPVQGQGREFIRQNIQKHGSCRNVAITRTNGDLMLYGTNGWAASGCPTGLTDALDELTEEGKYIDDVQLTENGSWLILYGDNGFRWSNIPYSLERKIREYNDQGEVVLSVTFNDNGDWIVITKNYYSASDSDITEWLQQGNDKYGMLWSACITDDALVAVFAEGYKFAGNTPTTLQRGLDEAGLDVYRLKIAGSAWFIADTEGRYHYNM